MTKDGGRQPGDGQLEEAFRMARYDSFLVCPEMAAGKRVTKLREKKRAADHGGPPLTRAEEVTFRFLGLLYPPRRRSIDERTPAEHPFWDLPAEVEATPEPAKGGRPVARMSGTPQGDRWTLVEHPTYRKRQDRFTEALSGRLFEFVDRSEILGEACTLEFRIDLPQIIALELGISGHPPAEETTTERAVAQDSQSGVLGIGQHVHIDLTLKEVIGRPHGIELGVGPEHTHLCRRKVADADHPNLALAPPIATAAKLYLEHVPPKLKLMGFDGIHGAFWIGDSTGIDSPLGGGRCRRPILLIFEVG